jgi:MFS transporter, OCT family, solute carrier family 22 (organic cation transporter), member 4/5
MKYFPGDIYINGIFGSFADMSAYTIGAVIYERIGFRLSGCYLFFSSAIGSMLILQFGFLEGLPWWAFPTLVVITKFGLSAMFSIVYIANANYFPTLFSTTAMGLSNFVARMACIAAPQVAELENKKLPIMILTCSSIVGALTILMLEDDS